MSVAYCKGDIRLRRLRFGGAVFGWMNMLSIHMGFDETRLDRIRDDRQRHSGRRDQKSVDRRRDRRRAWVTTMRYLGAAVALATLCSSPGCGRLGYDPYEMVDDSGTAALDDGGTALLDAHDRIAGALVAYTFDEGSGVTVVDRSTVLPPLHLTISDSNAVTWNNGGSLTLDAKTRITHLGTAQKVVDRLMAANELSIEVWITPTDGFQSGPARLITLARDPIEHNFMLGQTGDAFIQRLRTTNTDDQGEPGFTTPSGTARLALTHLVFTRTATGQETLYIDANVAATYTRDGTFDSWDATQQLCLGNDPTGDRGWQGTLHFAAVYDRTLTSSDVQQNFDVGPE